MLELFATALRVKTADASGGLDNYVGLPRHSDSHPLARLDFPTVLQARANVCQCNGKGWRWWSVLHVGRHVDVSRCVERHVMPAWSKSLHKRTARRALLTLGDLRQVDWRSLPCPRSSQPCAWLNVLDRVLFRN